MGGVRALLGLVGKVKWEKALHTAYRVLSRHWWVALHDGTFEVQTSLCDG